MDVSKAFQVLSEVGAKFVGNLADHQAIQQALSVLKGLVDAELNKPAVAVAEAPKEA